MKFQQQIDLKILTTDCTVHFQCLFLQRDAEHRNQYDEYQTTGKAKEHRTTPRRKKALSELSTELFRRFNGVCLIAVRGETARWLRHLEV